MTAKVSRTGNTGQLVNPRPPLVNKEKLVHLGRSWQGMTVYPSSPLMPVQYDQRLVYQEKLVHRGRSWQGMTVYPSSPLMPVQ